MIAAFKKDRTRKRNLSVEQLRAIRDIKPDAHDSIYRDFFLLGFYLTGMNLSDILDLTKEDYKDGRISFFRNKTNRLYDIRVEPDLTSYWNRHTWATFAAKTGIPMEIIGRASGHSIWDNSITGVYVEYDTSKIDEANRKVIDYLNDDL